MTRTLPALHDGHAPFHLHQAFSDALDAFEDWLPSQPEPRVVVDQTPAAISAVFGRMRSCSDLLPARHINVVKGLLSADVARQLDDRILTYADVATPLRARCVERFKNIASAFGDETSSPSLRSVLS